jgi:homoserine dehydrogenase
MSFGDLLKKAGAMLEQAKDAIADKAEALKDAVEDKVADIDLGEIKNAVMDKVHDAQEAFSNPSELVEKAKNAMGSPSDLVEKAKNVVIGAKDAVANKIEELNDLAEEEAKK